MRPRSKPASVRRVTRILVIEDDRPIRELFRDVLSDEGYELLFAERLEDAAVDAHPDVVVADLAGIHVYESPLARALVRRIQERYPRAPIIVCTAHGQAMEESDRLGAAAVLHKPFPIERLVEAVARLASR